MNKLRLLLLRTLDIRAADLRRTLMMQAYLFIIISVLLFLKPVSNSIFLSTFGIQQLPYVFIAVAIAAFIFTKIYSLLQQRYTFIKLHRIILAGIFISLCLFIVGLQVPLINGFIIYAFYIWVAIFALVATSQFWILGNIVFNPREARRVFGIIGAGGIAGGVFGGYLTSLLVPYVGNTGILILSAVFIAFCFPLVQVVWKENQPATSEDSLVIKKRRKVAQKFSFRRLYKSRHLILLALLTGTGVFVSKLVDFQFQGIAAAKFSDPEALTSFFAFWFSTFNVIGLIIQLFLTSRILKYFGVSKSQFFLPGSFVITGVLLFFFPVLWCALLLKGADGTLKQSIQRSVNELLMLPIPKEIKEQSKTFIDVFVDSFATGLSGLLLIFLLSRSNVTSTYVSLSIVFLSLIWLVLAGVMKKEYFSSFKRQFLSTSPSLENLVESKNTFYQNLDALLDAENENELLKILGNLESLPRGLDYSKTLSLLGHPNPEIRFKALQLRPFPHRKIRPQILELMMNDPDLRIRVESILFLLERDSNISENDLGTELLRSVESEDPALLFASCIFFRNNPRLKRKFNLKERLTEIAHQILLDRAQEFDNTHKFFTLRAIAHGRFVSLYHFIDLYLESKLVANKSLAIQTCSFTLSRKYAMILVGMLQNDTYRDIAAQSLKYYEGALLTLSSEIISSPNLKNRAKSKFVQTLSSVGTQNAANYLADLLNHESFKIRKEALTQLNLMKSQYPRLDFKKDQIFSRVKKEVRQIKKLYSILYSLNNHFREGPENPNSKLFKKKMQVIRRLRLLIKKRVVSIFFLLGLEYEKKDIFDIYNGLQTEDELKRTYSLEFLEMMVDYKYGQILSPILETNFKEEFTERDFHRMRLKSYSGLEALRRLFKFPDAKMRNRILRLFAHKEFSEYQVILNNPPRNLSPLMKEKLRVAKQIIKSQDYISSAS